MARQMQNTESYIISDGKDLIINFGEDRMLIENIFLKTIQSSFSQPVMNVGSFGSSFEQQIAGPLYYDIDLQLTGSRISTIDQNTNLDIKNIYNLSIFEIMKIVNERITNV